MRVTLKITFTNPQEPGEIQVLEWRNTTLARAVGLLANYNNQKGDLIRHVVLTTSANDELIVRGTLTGETSNNAYPAAPSPPQE